MGKIGSRFCVDFGRSFDYRHLHQPSLSGAELRLGKPPSLKGEGSGLPSRSWREAATKAGAAPKLEERRRAQRLPVHIQKGLKIMFFYVYMLSDCATHTHHYVGMTSLKPAQRLAVHNAGSVPHTSKFRPWEIDAVVAVKDKTTAASLESNILSREPVVLLPTNISFRLRQNYRGRRLNLRVPPY